MSEACFLTIFRRRGRLIGFVSVLVGFWMVVAVHGGGVTVVTHGLNGRVEDWIIPMADQVAGHPSFVGGEVSCYEISVTSAGASATFLGGALPLESTSGEILVKLDWSTLALLFPSSSTTSVAETAAAALISPTLVPELGGRALAELPLHLVGHSRGGSVVTEMARLLGAQGIWVDQVTTIDPRPVPEFGDAEVATYANVLFADNYWQTLGDGLFVPNGQAVPGAYNRKLLDLTGASSSSHQDAHLWYHGTIELGTPATDTQATITASERSAWWEEGEAEGADTGFRFSRIGGGDRLSTAEPAGAGNGRISDGINRMWDFGAGTAGNRTPLPSNSGLWPNVIAVELVGGVPADLNAPVEMRFSQQSGAAATGVVEIQISLDPDFNPWNGNESDVTGLMVEKTGTADVASTTSEVTLGPAASGLASGSYAILLQIRDGSISRYAYAAETVAVGMPGGGLPVIDPGSVVVTATEVRFSVNAEPGQNVGVYATTDLEDWALVGSQVSTGAVWEFVDPERASFPRRIYKAEPVL